MKPEDMTRDELIAEVKNLKTINYNLTLQAETAWSRYEQANKMTKSYMEEFASRRMMYIPKESNDG